MGGGYPRVRPVSANLPNHADAFSFAAMSVDITIAAIYTPRAAIRAHTFSGERYHRDAPPALRASRWSLTIKRPAPPAVKGDTPDKGAHAPLRYVEVQTVFKTVSPQAALVH
jgi:hypothetical protein